MSSPNDELTAAIAERSGLDAEQVAAVLGAWQDALAGDPVGTIRRHRDGSVAHRVATDGIVMWRVSRPDGEQFNDMQPTLSEWVVVYTPEVDGE